MNQIFILLIIIYVNIATSYKTRNIDCDISHPSSQEDCHSHNVDEHFRCCYVEYIFEDEDNDNEKVPVKKCHAIKWDLDEINSYANGLKDYDKVEVICKSNFIRNSLLLISSILFILF